MLQTPRRCGAQVDLLVTHIGAPGFRQHAPRGSSGPVASVDETNETGFWAGLLGPDRCCLLSLFLAVSPSLVHSADAFYQKLFLFI